MKILRPIVISFSIILAFTFLHVLTCKGQEISETKTLDSGLTTEVDFEKDYNSILDYEETNICVEENISNLSCTKQEPIIQYLFISDRPVIFEINERINLITKNTRTTEDLSGKLKTRIYGSDAFINVDGLWYETEFGKVSPEVFQSVSAKSLTKLYLDKWNPFKIYHVNAQDVYYSNSGDGYIRNSNADWATCRTAGTGTDNVEDSDLNTDVIAGTTGGTEYIDWIRMNFDTSAIDGTVDTATLNVYVWDYTAAQNVDWVTTYNTIESLTDLENTDFDLRGFERYTDVVTHGTENEWVTMTFTATATAAINVDGYTKLAITDDNDLTGIAPSDFVQGFIYTSFHAGTEYDPYLEVTLAGEPACPDAECNGTEDCSTCPEDCGECTSTTTVYASACTPENSGNLGVINACSYLSSTTGITYTNYYTPFLNWLVIIIPAGIMFHRLLIEYLIRMRK